MKILLLSNIFPPGFIGGYELGAYDVAKGLVAKGHYVKVLTSDYFNDEEPMSDSHFCVERNLNFSSPLQHQLAPVDNYSAIYYDFNNIRKIGTALRTFKPNVVLAFNLNGLGVFSILHLLQSIQIPTVVYLMDNIFSGIDANSGFHRKFERYFGHFSPTETTSFIAMSTIVAREVEKAIKTQLNKVTFIPGWVDFSLFKNTPNTQINPERRFVFSSRIAPHKGIHILLDAVQILSQKGISNFTVDVYGDGDVIELIQKIHLLKLQHLIRFRGCVSKTEMINKLSEYDSLLFPTWEREPFGFIASEAAAAGTIPIITSSIGAAEWFLNGFDCIKIIRSPTSLANSITELIKMDNYQLASLKHNAQITARKYFDFSHWLNIIEAECLQQSTKICYSKSENNIKKHESALFCLNSLFNVD
jgi:glycogen(starch) synthase